jgi:hypothetical protein
MRRYSHFVIMLFLLLYGLPKVNAQSNNLIAERKKLVLLIDINTPKNSIDSILKRAGVINVNAQDIINGHYSALINGGWLLVKKQDNVIQFNFSIKTLKGNPQQSPYFVTSSAIKTSDRHGYPDDIVYGINKFAAPTVTELPSGLTRFYFKGSLSARRVFLSGSFNDWSTLQGLMSKSGDGWIIDLKLKPGAYEYKFIVDGNWTTDPGNSEEVNDGAGNTNSIYFKYNYIFKLKGYANAQQVVVAGNFAHGNDNELMLTKKGDTWELPLYLREGNYNYRFIVDGKSITDPVSPTKSTDDNGVVNSVANVGETVYFKLSGYANAQNVYVAGNFAKWESGKIKLKKSDGGWVVPIVLKSGNYQYKFIVDGNWITDPANPAHAVEGGQVNSFLAVNPTHTFKLSGHSDAKVVHIAGNFNNWDPDQYLMGHTGNEWSISLCLKPGKCLYKFLVDDNWILDPGNKYWEQNEHNNGNSVLWVGQ